MNSLSSKIKSLQPLYACYLTMCCFLSASEILGQAKAGADAYRFLNFGKETGLRGSKPTCVFQDSYGFVWIGTWDGLYRFDGYSFKLFEHKPGDLNSLPSNFIAYHAFYEDQNRDLWIATFDAGFVKFDRKTERFTSFREAAGRLSSDAVNALRGDGRGGVWIGTRGSGLSHYFPEQDSFFNYTLTEYAPDTLMGSRTLLELCLSHNGLLWIGTNSGVASLDSEGHFRRYYPDYSYNSSLSDRYVTDIFEDNKNRIWVCSQNGLNMMAAPEYFVHYYPTHSPNVPNYPRYNNIQRVYQDKSGDFWLGTLAGLLRFYPEDNEYETIRHNPLDPYSIVDGGIHGITEDNQGHLWFAADGGLSLLDKGTALFQDKNWAPVQTLMPQVRLLNGGVCLAETGDRIWLATAKGLYTFRPGQSVQRFLSGDFTALFVDSKGWLFAGTGQEQFFIIDPKNLRVLEKKKKEKNKSRSRYNAVGLRNTSFAEDRNGNYWIGSLGALNRFDPGRREYCQFESRQNEAHSLTNPDINDLHIDSQGNLWIATMGGVNMLTAEELKRPITDTALHFIRFQHIPNQTNTISNDHVRVICEDSRGWFWFGTDAGLNLLYPDGQWRRFFKEDGLPENHITGITEDNEGNIWLTTPSQGIAKYEVQKRRFMRLTKRDGMNTEQFPSNACLKLHDGRLVFAGVGGLNVFDPRNIIFRFDSLPLYFTELKLFNQVVKPGDKRNILSKPIYMTQEIELDFEQNVISLQFAALNFTNPEKQVYRFRLLGFEALEDWQYLDNGREINLTNLFPGTYTLRVESTTSPGAREHWESAVTLIIHVRYPWYLKWWAFLFYAAIIFGSFYAFYKFRVKRKLAAAETRRLQELDAVKTKLYTNITHEFRTPLTVILGEASQLEKQIGEKQRGGLAAIHRQGQHLLNLVNQMLDLAKVEAGSLRLTMVQGNVILFLKYLLESFHSLAADNQIELRFESDKDEFWMDFDPDKLRKITGNLLSNALKFTPEGGQVMLRVTSGDKLEIRVSDTGQGIPPEKLPFIFDRFYQADDSATRHAEGTGIGLTLTKELVQLLDGQIGVESNAGQGTVFTVTLPVSREAEKQATQAGEFFPEIESVAPVPDAIPPVLKDITFPSPARKNLPHLLIIEDNADVARYISALLTADYRINVAQNGKEGLEAALRQIPDLIISDVMMPEMDGFEVCHALKTDVRTSHIPVILLTAKVDLESRIEGLEHGADAYLAKPFEEQELKVQLRKLHKLRQTLRERYARPGLPAQSDLPVFRREDVFFQNLHAVLEKNFPDAEFGVPELCAAMTMSRPNLFRKLTALTGKNIENYLRSFRLNKAHEMLRNSDSTVQAIAWDCGFKDVGHFTRVFHTEFGVPPSQAR